MPTDAQSKIVHLRLNSAKKMSFRLIPECWGCWCISRRIWAMMEPLVEMRIASERRRFHCFRLFESLQKTFPLDECFYTNHFADAASDIFDLLFRQFRKHRQRKKFLGQILRDWKRALRVPKVSAGLLEMNRNGIVHATANAFLLQKSPNFVAFLYPDRINVINVPCIIRLERRRNLIDSRESVIVLQRMFAPQEICSLEMTQFDGQDCCLNAVHPAIPTHRRMIIFLRLTVVSQHLDLLP